MFALPPVSLRGFEGRILAIGKMARASLSSVRMSRSSWKLSLVMPLAVMSLACGGTAFSTDTGADGGDGGSSSSGASSSGSGSSGGSGSSSGGSGGGSGSSGASSSGSGSSSGSSGGSDGGSGSPCPVSEPMSKASCSPQGLECEYGSNPVQGCDAVSTCEGTWQTTAPGDSNCSTTLGGGCPLTFDGVSQGSTCADRGLICNYPRGRCACTESLGGPVMLVDASTPGHWYCQDPGTTGCPMPRPPLGSACTDDGVSCDYGTCNVPGGSAEQCEDGIWKPEAVPCPLNAAQ
jgi:hypothetical protein